VLWKPGPAYAVPKSWYTKEEATRANALKAKIEEEIEFLKVVAQ
jgi:hypothetical protein